MWELGLTLNPFHSSGNRWSRLVLSFPSLPSLPPSSLCFFFFSPKTPIFTKKFQATLIEGFNWAKIDQCLKDIFPVPPHGAFIWVPSAFPAFNVSRSRLSFKSSSRTLPKGRGLDSAMSTHGILCSFQSEWLIHRNCWSSTGSFP